VHLGVFELGCAFVESYVVPYVSFEDVERIQTFKELLILMKSKEHLNLEGLINKVLPLWDSLRGLPSF
jgi:hypothetical protein